MVKQQPFIPATTTTSSTSTTTTTTTQCVATITTNPLNLKAYKGIAIGIPGFTFYAIHGGSKIRANGFRIKDLPNPADGVLYLGKVPVVDEQLITPLQNGRLVYKPAANADASASFNFLVETACGNGASTAVNIAVSAAPVDDDDCNCSSSTSSSSSTTTTAP